MRRSRERRRQGIPRPPEKTFKYLVRCTECGRGFLLPKKNLDLSSLRCDICNGKLKYQSSKWVGTEEEIKFSLTAGSTHQPELRSKKMAKVQKKTSNKVGDRAKSIRELLVSLEKVSKSADKAAGRKIRQALRKLGHKGGLNKPRKVSQKKTGKKKGKKSAA